MVNTFVNNNSLNELSFNDLVNINGGANWLKVIGGVLMVVGTIIIGGPVAIFCGIVGGVYCIIEGL